MSEQPPDEIAVSFTYSLAEFRRVSYWMMVLQPSVLIAFAVIAVGVIFSPIFIASFVAVLVLYACTPWWRFSRRERVRAPQHFVFSSSGIEYRSDNVETKLDWKMVRDLRECRSAFALMIKEPGGVIVLKRAFPDEAAVAAFRALCATHIPAPDARERDAAAYDD